MNKRKPIRHLSTITTKRNLRSIFALGSVAVLPAISALAQEATNDTVASGFKKSPPPGGAGWESAVDLGYVGGTSAKFQGTRTGSSDAFDVKFDAGTRVTLNDDWFLRLGLGSDNIFLGSVAGEPIPDAIHTLQLNTGVGYRWDDRWTFMAVLNPSLLRFDDVNGNDIGFSGGVMATFKQNPSLTWTFGIMGSQYGDVPVLPIVGVHWEINEHYTLDVGMPKTRLSYRLDSNWTVYGGLDLVGATFRSENDLGTKTGLPRYNNALANYHDIRLGVGVSYKIRRGLSAEVETGASIFREINYQDINQTVDFQPAPYVRLGLRIRF